MTQMNDDYKTVSSWGAEFGGLSLDESSNPYEDWVRIELHRALAKMLKKLPEPQRTVVSRLYDLNGDSCTRKELMRSLGTTHKNVREIEDEALLALRKMSGRYRLREYLS